MKEPKRVMITYREGRREEGRIGTCKSRKGVQLSFPTISNHACPSLLRSTPTYLELARIRVPQQVDWQAKVDGGEEEQVDDHEEPEDVSLLVQARLGPAGGGPDDEHGHGLQDQETGGGGAPDEVAPEAVDLFCCLLLFGV